MTRGVRQVARFGLLALAVVAGDAAPVAAQEPGPPAVRQDDRFAPESRPWLRSRLERVRRERMARFLGLDSADAERLDRELRAFRARQVELRRERHRILAEMNRALADSAGRAARVESLRDELLRGNLQALRHNEEELRRALEELRQSLGRDLTVEQRARLHIFAERFQHQLEEHARRIRDRRGGGGGELPARRRR